MSRITDAWRALVNPAPPQSEPMPKTKIMPGQEEKNPYARMGLNAKEDRRKKIKRYLDSYRRGGPAAEAVDSYVLHTLSNGYELTCEDGYEALKDRVQEWLDQPHVDIESWWWEGILSAILAGDSYQELIMDRAGMPWGLVTRDPSMFSKDFDDKGRVTGYTQHIPSQYFESIETSIKIPAESIINLVLFRVPGSVYGQSIWERAEDDILRDTDMVESLTKAMHRHGTPKQQWAVGTDEQPASDADLAEVESKIKTVNALTDFATTHDIQINPLDTTGITGAQEFSNITLQRMACSLGVPEENIGLGRGSTEATANVRLDTFRDKVSTIQKIVERTYNRELIDRITGIPGSVWIEFNDINPEDESKKAAWISLLRGGTDPDACVPAWWVREQFGIPPDKEGEDLIDYDKEKEKEPVNGTTPEIQVK